MRPPTMSTSVVARVDVHDHDRSGGPIAAPGPQEGGWRSSIRVLVAAAVIAAVIGACGNDIPTPSPTPSFTPPPDLTAPPTFEAPTPAPTHAPSVQAVVATVTATVKIGPKGANGVNAAESVVGFGSLWVPFYGSPRGWVVRIDLASHKVTARIQVGESPGSLAVASGSVWVANDAGDASRHYRGQNTLSRIDPATNAVTQTVHLKIGGPIAGGLGGVWVPDYQNGDGNGLLQKVDALSGQVIDAYPVQGRPVVACGTLWVIDTLVAVEAPEVTVLSSVNPRTGLRTGEHPLVAPGMEGPAKVDGECMAAWSTQDDSGTWFTGLVARDAGVMRPSPPIPERLRLMDGGVWAAYSSNGTYQRLTSQGAPVGGVVALPPETTKDGDEWFTVIRGTGWVITNRNAYVLALP